MLQPRYNFIGTGTSTRKIIFNFMMDEIDQVLQVTKYIARAVYAYTIKSISRSTLYTSYVFCVGLHKTSKSTFVIYKNINNNR